MRREGGEVSSDHTHFLILFLLYLVTGGRRRGGLPVSVNYYLSVCVQVFSMNIMQDIRLVIPP